MRFATDSIAMKLPSGGEGRWLQRLYTAATMDVILGDDDSGKIWKRGNE